jgi:hypothetical protein
MKKNINQLNPNLEVGDRIILVHMDDEYDLPFGEQKGIVKGIVNTPKFSSSDSGYGYKVEWLDNDGNIISKLILLPDSDAWIFDKEYYKNLK